MANKEGLAAQLESIIDQHMLPLEEGGHDVDVNRVSEQVLLALDPDRVSPDLVSYCTNMHIKGVVRKRAAKRHDPVARAEEYIEGNTEDMFSGILQAYYPESKDVYVPRNRLTETGYKRVRARMKKAGHALLEHVDALDAWWAGRAA
jgi:hypothetical protein